MSGKDIMLLTIVLGVTIILYFGLGMTKVNDEYTLKGWFFAPARLLKRFICGMILGHDWITKDNECYCSFCLKKRRHNGTSIKFL